MGGKRKKKKGRKERKLVVGVNRVSFYSPMRCAVLQVGRKSRNCGVLGVVLLTDGRSTVVGFSCIVNLLVSLLMLGGRKKLVCGVRDYDTWDGSLLLIIRVGARDVEGLLLLHTGEIWVFCLDLGGMQ